MAIDHFNLKEILDCFSDKNILASIFKENDKQYQTSLSEKLKVLFFKRPILEFKWRVYVEKELPPILATKVNVTHKNWWEFKVLPKVV